TNLVFVKIPEFLYLPRLPSVLLHKATIHAGTFRSHNRRRVSGHSFIFVIREHRHFGVSCPIGEPLRQFSKRKSARLIENPVFRVLNVIAHPLIPQPGFLIKRLSVFPLAHLSPLLGSRERRGSVVFQLSTRSHESYTKISGEIRWSFVEQVASHARGCIRPRLRSSPILAVVLTNPFPGQQPILSLWGVHVQGHHDDIGEWQHESESIAPFIAAKVNLSTHGNFRFVILFDAGVSTLSIWHNV